MQSNGRNEGRSFRPLKRLARRTAGTDPGSGYFQSASQSIAGKYEIHSTAKFEWNEFSNYAGSIARSAGGCNRGTADFLPFDGQPAF
jgi:hypothetical protein